MQSASILMTQHKSFQVGLTQWRTMLHKSEEPSLLVYVLEIENPYNLKLSVLEWGDYHRVELLKTHYAK